MRHILIIFSIFLFSFTIISCGEKEEHTNTNDNTTTDTTAPVIAEVTAVTTPTNDSTPNYTFSSSEAGAITYGGSCSSVTTTATIGNNTITLVSLSEGTYSNCTITVTDTTGNVSDSLTITSFIVDTTAATLVEVTAVKTPANDSTPDYTFSSSEAGTINYGGSCSSNTTSATIDNNTITLNSLSDGTYSNCTISVEDNASNSVTLNMSQFVIETVSPIVSSISPTDNQSDVSISGTISVTFSESIDTSSVNTNTSNTSCSGSLQLSANNFSSCIQMSSSPSSSNSDKTFTLDPFDNLSLSNTYKIRVTTGIKDTVGNTLSSRYETTNGFATCSNNVTFVAVGGNSSPSEGFLRTSSNGTSCWISRNIGTSNVLYSGTYANNTFITVGHADTSTYPSLLTSSDGTTWTSRNTSGVMGTGKYIWEIIYANNKFLAVGGGGKIITSTNNGVTWSVSATVGTAQFLGVAYGNNTYVAGNEQNGIYSSTDGTNWTQRDSSISVLDVAFGNNTFVVVGPSGKILSSTDGTNWTSRTSGTTNYLHEVAFGNDTFVATGNQGTIRTSSNNGVTWTSRSSGTTRGLVGITFANGIFVVAGDYGTILTSSDNGNTWTSRTSGTNEYFWGIFSKQ